MLPLLVVFLQTGCVGTAAGSPSGTSPSTIARTPSTTSTVTRLIAPSTSTSTTAAPVSHGAEGPIVSVVLVGDVMLGRGVASTVHNDPDGLFEDVRRVVTGADIAAANLESPLTLRPHIADNPFALEAEPAAVGSLATAGFDLLGIANNHAGDAGRLSILDTITAAQQAGLATVGGGAQLEDAFAVEVFEHNGLEVGFLAFDATWAGTPATAEHPGIASWDEERVQSAVESARAQVDLLIVGIHGGVEYYRDTDPGLAVLADKLVAWGVDVVWGHGPHVIQPVYLDSGTRGRTTVIATSLGNFLFDQAAAGTREGAVLEVLADARGVFAYRTGTAGHHDGRVHFDGWASPQGDAVLLGLEWWSLVRAPGFSPARSAGARADGFAGGDVIDVRTGDVTGDGREEVVISHRRPYEENDITSQYPKRPWADRWGRSAHLGVYRLGGLQEVWVAGTLFRPIARMAVCDGSLALAFDSLDDAAIVATGGWVWQGFGFAVPTELAGPGTPGCVDVDGDGRLDPVIIDRS
jgi:poly-gamma-glutamate synthesis protein (capsule biosynthesis protein)